jgi:hypothetical protein
VGKQTFVSGLLNEVTKTWGIEVDVEAPLGALAENFHDVGDEYHRISMDKSTFLDIGV